jgi:hypothetical protein
MLGERLREIHAAADIGGHHADRGRETRLLGLLGQHLE